MTSIAQADTSTGGRILALIVFVLIASVTVGGVVIWYLIAGKSAAAKLNEVKGWLMRRNNAVVMAVLLLVLGVSQVGKGIGGLFG